MDIMVCTEGKRGCGYRKQGGMYLIAGKPNSPCGKLPLPLTVCPTCNQGIKPARGWTWVNGAKLAEGVTCRFAAEHGGICGGCPMYAPADRVGLIWIGEQHYKTPAEFMTEARKMGISRRLPNLPVDFKLWETWVWLAHRKGIPATCEHPMLEEGEEPKQCPDCHGEGVTYTPAVFTAFMPERMDYVVKDDDDEEKLERMVKKGFTLVRIERADGSEEEEGEDL